jgi:hypothetical protein
MIFIGSAFRLPRLPEWQAEFVARVGWSDADIRRQPRMHLYRNV